RSDRDWSSDVCSSDLADVRLKHDITLLGHLDNGRGFYHFMSIPTANSVYAGTFVLHVGNASPCSGCGSAESGLAYLREIFDMLRSEERRVGKECRCRG